MGCFDRIPIASGRCMCCSGDSYLIELDAEKDLYIELEDRDFNEGVTVYIPREKAIEIANKILEELK